MIAGFDSFISLLGDFANLASWFQTTGIRLCACKANLSKNSLAHGNEIRGHPISPASPWNRSSDMTCWIYPTIHLYQHVPPKFGMSWRNDGKFCHSVKKKVSYMKKQPDLFLNPIKHLLKKNTLIYNLTELLQHSLQRPKWDKKTCPPKTCPSVLHVATGSQITPYQVHNIWRDSKLTTPRLMM